MFTRWPITLLALIGGLAVVGLHLSRRIYPIDLEVYRRGAMQLTTDQSLYADYFDFGDVALPFTYPPFAAWLMQALNWGSLDAVKWGLTFGNAAVLLVCAWLVALRCGHPRARAFQIAAIAWPFMWLIEPVVRTNEYGQVNILLMGLVLLDLVPRRTLHPRGMLIGIAAAIKLTPAIFGLYLLLKKDYRGAAWATGTGLVVSAVMWLVYPQDSKDYWLGALRDTSRVGYEGYVANQSIKGLLVRALGEGSHTDQIWLGCALAVLALTAVTMWYLLRQGTTTAELGAIFVNAAAMLLLSPISWSHHFVWAAVVVVYLFAAGVLSRSTSWAIWAVLLGVAVAYGPHWYFEELGFTHGWIWWKQILASTYPLLALAGIGLALVGAVRRGRNA